MVEKKQKESKTSDEAVRTPRMRKTVNVAEDVPKTSSKLRKKSPETSRVSNISSEETKKLGVRGVLLVCLGLVGLVLLIVFLMVGRANLRSNTTSNGGGGLVKKSAMVEAYDACVVLPETEQNYLKMVGDDLILVKLRLGDLDERKGELHCVLSQLGESGEFNEMLDDMSAFDMGKFEFGEYTGLLRMDYDWDDKDNSMYYAAVYENGKVGLAMTKEVCDAMYEDKGEPVKSRYSYDSYDEYKAAEDAYVSYGTLRLGDGGKTLIYTDDGRYTSKKKCVYEVIGVPERIQTAIGNSTGKETRKEEWGGFVAEWTPGDGDLMIYQY